MKQKETGASSTGGPVVKNPPCSARGTGWIPALGRSHVARSSPARAQLLCQTCRARSPRERPPQ